MSRLGVVCSLIEPASVIADVGCDHGKVALYCAKNSLAKTVIASDISEECLDKARTMLADHSNVRFIHCDGIAYECDEAIVAGMGGVLISDILKRALVKPRTLIVCPHRNPETVRMTLDALGYAIDTDTVCVERGKYYSVIRGKLGDHEPLDDMQIDFGVFYKTKKAELKDMLLKMHDTYMRAPQNNKIKLEKIRSALVFQGIELSGNQL